MRRAAFSVRRAACGVLLPVLLGGCASAAGEGVPVAERDHDFVQVTPGEGMTLTREGNISTGVVAATPAELWPSLVSAYEEAGLPVTEVDAAHHLLASQAGKLRRIAGAPVDRFFDCPGTAYGNSATSGDVYVTVRTQLLAAPAGSEVRMQVEARSIATSGARAHCRSNGRLERFLRDALGGASEGSQGTAGASGSG